MTIKLSDIKINLPFKIQKNMYIGHLMDWKDGIHKYEYKVDFDVYLPSKGINLQRDFCWTIEQKQELIRSIIKGADIQTFTVIVYIEDSIKRDTTFKFIDGKQRFSTLLDFIQDKFPVKLLGNNYLYSELPIDIKYVIDHFEIHFNQTYEYHDDLISDDLKIAWFEQINFAGTPQDIKHLNRLKSEKKTVESICGGDTLGSWCVGCLEKLECKLYISKS